MGEGDEQSRAGAVSALFPVDEVAPGSAGEASECVVGEATFDAGSAEGGAAE